MDKVRQDFEEWVVQEFPFSITDTTFHKLVDEYGKLIKYSIDEVNRLWLGWKAAHSKYHNGVVELPRILTPIEESTFKVGAFFGRQSYQAELKDALDKAGVKYK